MEYRITIPRNSGDNRGETYIVDDFSSLRNFISSYYSLIDDGGKSIHGKKTLDNFLTLHFTESDLNENHYIHSQCLHQARSGRIMASWDEFMDHDEFFYSSYESTFVKYDEGVEIMDMGWMVSHIYASRNFYFHDDDGQWYSYPMADPYEDEDNEGTYVRPYHSGSVKWHPIFNEVVNNLPDFDYRIGIEFEKEDYDVLTSIYIDDFEDQFPEWRKESDGSLDDESGFELISPIYPLNPDFIIEDIKRSNYILINHIHAEVSSSCGGHMNVSSKVFSPVQLFDQVKWYLPLLYAMYPNRRKVTYCEKKKIIGNESSFERKYSPIYIKSDCIEFRIFSAIKNTDQLYFRLKLIEMMMRNPLNDFDSLIKTVEENEHIFSMVYSSDSFNRLIDRIKIEISDELKSVA